LESKVVLITGAGRGIGRATALAAAREGAHVLVNDLGCDASGAGSDEGVAQAVSEQIVREGGEALADPSDICDFASASALVARAVERWGRLDGVVASAGLGHQARIGRVSEDRLDLALGVAIRGPYGLLRAAAEEMTPRGGGSIVLTAGPEGLFGLARRSLDAATAGALIGLGRSAAVELRRQGIRVNVLAPTAATRVTNDTKLFVGISPDSMRAEDVAPVTLFLLSDLATDVHGEVLGVAGERVYSIESREAVGAYANAGRLEPSQILSRWAEITGS
jgi:NAD(P)-dependent dehydrogenase (short-subunit alcohol dehydrogenase family)